MAFDPEVWRAAQRDVDQQQIDSPAEGWISGVDIAMRDLTKW